MQAQELPNPVVEAIKAIFLGIGAGIGAGVNEIRDAQQGSQSSPESRIPESSRDQDLNRRPSRPPVPAPLPTPQPVQPVPRAVPKPNDCKCRFQELPYHLGGKFGAGYATHVTGSVGDFQITPPSGIPRNFDGLVRSNSELRRRYPEVIITRHVVEAKLTEGQQITNPFLRNIELTRFANLANSDQTVAKTCGFRYSFVVSNKGFGEDLKERIPNISIYWIPN